MYYRIPSFGTQINKSHHLFNGLIGLWVMNEGGGGTFFNSASMNNASVVTAGAWTRDGYAGDGLSTDVTTKGHNLQDFTHVSIITPVTTSNQSISTMVDLPGRSSYDRSFWIDGSKRFVWYVYKGLTAVIVTATAPVATIGVTTHLSGTCKSGNISIWVDGVLGASDTTAGTAWAYSSPTLQFFRGPKSILVLENDIYSSVNMQSYWIWNRSLLASEIADHAANPYAMFHMPSSNRLLSFIRVGVSGGTLLIEETDADTTTQEIKRDETVFSFPGDQSAIIYQIVEEWEVFGKKNGIYLNSENTGSLRRNGNLKSISKHKLEIILRSNTAYKIKYRLKESGNWGSWSTVTHFRTRDKDYKHIRKD